MNTKEYYCQLLSLDTMPKTPANLPRRIRLSIESLGDFGQAILETQRSSNEFMQSIYWRKEQFIGGRVYRGSRSSVDNGMVGLILEYFGRKPLINFHTHTTDGDERASYEPSCADVARFKACPRDSFIDLCGSKLGVSAILQTEKSAKLPISSFVERVRTLRKLDKLNFESITQDRQARVLENLGYGYYIWTPRRKRVYPGDLNNGIYLTRIQPRNS